MTNDNNKGKALMAENGILPLEDYLELDESELSGRIEAVRQQMGEKLLILGHHYQRDEVVEHCDLSGDSFELSRKAAENSQAEVIVFCGVHFMAETADILANRPEQVKSRGGKRVPVILPNLDAGCPMADMASLDQVSLAWKCLGDWIDTNDLMPVTYVNSSAEIKAFCGKRGGAVCTSSNAETVVEWALMHRSRVFFFPDQHLARNVGSSMGISLRRMPVWDPMLINGGLDEQTVIDSRIILWKGCCDVHQEFKRSHIDALREKIDDLNVIVHPECDKEVVDQSDQSGSTGLIIKVISAAKAGSRWAIGTERRLVGRLAKKHPEKEIYHFDETAGVCESMGLTDLPRLAWVLENLAAGNMVNEIRVEDETAHGALAALERMLIVN
jgi:quinolinate synthase